MKSNISICATQRRDFITRKMKAKRKRPDHPEVVFVEQATSTRLVHALLVPVEAQKEGKDVNII